MFGIFSNNHEAKEAQNDKPEEAVILEIPLESGEEHGTPQERGIVEDLRKAIESTLPDNCEYDGHEYGEGVCIVYLYGPSANSMFEALREVLKQSAFNRFEVTLQYGPPQDPSTQEEQFTLSW